MHGASLHRRHRFREVMCSLDPETAVQPAKALSRPDLPHALQDAAAHHLPTALFLPTQQRREPRANAAMRNISPPSKEPRAARQSVLGALVFNRLWELRHTNTRRIFNHTGMHHHFHSGRRTFEDF